MDNQLKSTRTEPSRFVLHPLAPCNELPLQSITVSQSSTVEMADIFSNAVKYKNWRSISIVMTPFVNFSKKRLEKKCIAFIEVILVLHSLKSDELEAS